MADFVFEIASAKQAFVQGRNLFEEYAGTLGFDLCFQNFSTELETIARQYNYPTGALLIVYDNDVAIACVGVRKLSSEIAELKRMFVKEAYRGQNIGQRMLDEIIAVAKSLRYKKIRLDTLSSMHAAIALYRSNGFYKIEPYYTNPIANAIYMEKLL